MKRLALTVAAISLAGALAACTKKEAATQTAAPAAPASAAAPAPAPANAVIGAMSLSTDAKMAKGTVTAVGAGSITIDHEAIPEAQWPAMTMGFKASPELARSVKVGDKVAFELKLKDGAGEVTAISKQ